MAKRKKYSSDFKLQVALAALKSGKVADVSRQFDVAAGLVSKWRQAILDNAAALFEKSPDKEKKNLKRKVEKLEQMIGQREVEIGLIKNFQDFYASHDGP